MVKATWRYKTMKFFDDFKSKIIEYIKKDNCEYKEDASNIIIEYKKINTVVHVKCEYNLNKKDWILYIRCRNPEMDHYRTLPILIGDGNVSIDDAFNAFEACIYNYNDPEKFREAMLKCKFEEDENLKF
jgi:hypothetical protein